MPRCCHCQGMINVRRWHHGIPRQVKSTHQVMNVYHGVKLGNLFGFDDVTRYTQNTKTSRKKKKNVIFTPIKKKSIRFLLTLHHVSSFGVFFFVLFFTVNMTVCVLAPNPTTLNDWLIYYSAQKLTWVWTPDASARENGPGFEPNIAIQSWQKLNMNTKPHLNLMCCFSSQCS